MIQYLCDCCKKVVDKPDETLMMPRKVIYYATCQGIKLSKIETFKTMPTILCDECYTKIANMLIET